MTNALVVFLGGGAGSVLRYLIGVFVRKSALVLPWATFISNISACLIFAIVIWIEQGRNSLPTSLSLLLLTGFCGGLSTFSTFGFETFMLFKNGMAAHALLNIAVSTGLALLMFYLLQRQTG